MQEQSVPINQQVESFMKVGVARSTIISLAAAVCLSVTGCATPWCKGTRSLAGGPCSDLDLKRSDFVVLNQVHGETTETSILLGIVKIIDGNKVEILGARFFKDQTARLPGIAGCIPCYWRSESRAYYKALAAAPDADGIIERSVTWEKSGVPLLFYTKKTDFQGKAIKLKPD